MKLSEYFNLSEFEYSEKAIAYGIKNALPRDLLPNIVRLHDNILYPLRKATGCPVVISSGFRCKALNNLVSKSNTSQHMEGKAADFVVKGQSNLSVINWIRKNCELDQLILEKVGGQEWVHVSYNFGKNRKQVLYYDGKSYTSF